MTAECQDLPKENLNTGGLAVLPLAHHRFLPFATCSELVFKPMDECAHLLLCPNAAVAEQIVQQWRSRRQRRAARSDKLTHFGASNIASTPCFRLRRSEKTPSSHFFIDLTGLPNASNRKANARTIKRKSSYSTQVIARRLTDISARDVEEPVPEYT